METVKLRINEAIGRAQTNGINVLKKDIASRIWHDSKESTQQVNMTNLCKGRTRKINPEWVIIICEMCGCTPNYLFGYEGNR